MVDIKGIFSSSPEKRLENIYDYIDTRKFDRALTLIQNGLKSDPTYIDYHQALFEVHARQGKINEARFAIEKLFKLKPTAAPDMVNRILDLAKDISHVSEYWDAFAGCEIKRKKLQAAYEYYKRATDDDCGKLYDRCHKQCEKVKKGPPEQLRSNLFHFFRLALLSEKLKRLKEAADAYKTIIQSDPSSMAMIAEHVQALVKTDMGLRNLRMVLGDLYAQTGKLDQALSEYSEVLKQDLTAAPSLVERAEELEKAHSGDLKITAFLVQVHLTTRNSDEALKLLAGFCQHGPKALDFVISKLPTLKDLTSDNPKVAFLEAKAYITKGNYDKGVRSARIALEQGIETASILPLLETAVKQDPKNEKAHEILGNAFFDSKQLAKAAHHYRLMALVSKDLKSSIGRRAVQILESEPDNVDGLLLLAQVAQKELHPDQLGVTAMRALRLAPEKSKDILNLLIPPGEHPYAYLALAECYLRLGDKDRFLKALSAFIQKYPDQIAQILRLSIRAAQTHKDLAPKLHELFARIPGEDAPRFFALGEFARAGGNFRSAFDRFKKVLSLEPSQAPLVQKTVEDIIQENPKEERIRMELVDLYFSLKLYDKIRPQLDRLLDALPQEMPRIVEKYKELRSKQPEDVDLLLGLMRAYLKARMPKAAAKLALEGLPLAKENSKAYAELQLFLGDALRDVGDLAKASARYGQAWTGDPALQPKVLARLETLVSKAPEERAGALWLSRLFAAESRWQEGIDLLKSVWEKSPEKESKQVLEELASHFAGSPDARLLEADIQIKQGNPDEAASALVHIASEDKEILRLAISRLNGLRKSIPDNVSLAMAEGELLSRTGSIESATRVFSEALQLAPMRHTDLLRHARELINHHPKELGAYCLAIECLFSGQKYRQALDILKSLPPDAVKDPDLLSQKLTSLASMVEFNPDVLTAMAEALMIHAKHDEAFALFSKASFVEGADLERILNGLDTVIKAGAQQAGHYMTRASIRSKAGLPDGVCLDVMKALELDRSLLKDALLILPDVNINNPEHYESTRILIDLYMESGRYEQVLEILERTPMDRMAPDQQSELRLREGCAREHQGDAEGALLAFTRAYETAPDFQGILHSVKAFSENWTARRITSMVEEGQLSAYSNNEISQLKKRLPSSLLPVLEKSKEDETARKEIRSRIYQWNGNTRSSQDLQQEIGPSLYFSFLAQSNGDYEQSAAALEGMTNNSEPLQTQKSLEYTLHALARRVLTRAPRVLIGQIHPKL